VKTKANRVLIKLIKTVREFHQPIGKIAQKTRKRIQPEDIPA